MSNSTPWTEACQADLICQVSIKFPQVKACQGIFQIKYHFILWNDFSLQGFFVCDSEFTLDVIIPYRSLYTGFKKTHTRLKTILLQRQPGTLEGSYASSILQFFLARLWLISLASSFICTWRTGKVHIFPIRSAAWITDSEREVRYSTSFCSDRGKKVFQFNLRLSGNSSLQHVNWLFQRTLI